MKKMSISLLAVLLSFMGCKVFDPGIDLCTNQTRSTASVQKDMSKVVIGVSNYTLNAPYYAAMSANIEKAAKAAGVKNVLATDAANDMNKQFADCEDLLAKGVDVLIINPKDPKAIIPVTKAASRAGVPVFIIDSGVDPSADFVSYIGADNVINSQLLGEYIAEEFKGREIRMAVLSGNKGNAVGLSRRGNLFYGLTEAQLKLKNSASYIIKSQGWGGWNQQQGLKATEDILTAHPDINLLYAENDSMALGAVKALKERKMLDKVMVVGFDGQKEGYKAIIDGELAATALNSPRIIANTAIEAIGKYLQGRNIPDRIITPAVLVTKENVKEHYNPDSIF
jgi:ribose transport system substrate-binding protein